MYRLKIKFGRSWKLGLVEYGTIQEANERINELKSLRKSVQVKVVDSFGGEI